MNGKSVDVTQVRLGPVLCKKRILPADTFINIPVDYEYPKPEWLGH